MEDHDFDWQQLIRSIHQRNLTPVISNQVVMGVLFPGKDVVTSWASEVEYPFAGSRNLTRVAQFVLYRSRVRNELAAKENYCAHLKDRLLQQAEEELGADRSYLAGLRRRSGLATFSQTALELRRPDFRQDPRHPLSILASLPIPVYLTTSHHRFMEAALVAQGKSPHTAVYCWKPQQRDKLQRRLETVDSSRSPGACEKDPYFKPDENEPLVFHLHGIDDMPESVVLTEEDYLQLFDTLTTELVEGPKSRVRESDGAAGIPGEVRMRLASDQLLLLGFDEQGWELRVLVHALNKVDRQNPGFAIPVVPAEAVDEEGVKRFQSYLEHFFEYNRFNVYWGDPQTFLGSLWDKWQEG